MESKEILKFCIEKGFLIDKEILDLFSGSENIDLETSKIIIEHIGRKANTKIISKNLFEKNSNQIFEIINEKTSNNSEIIKKMKINLGLSIEISEEVKQKKEFKPIKELKNDLENVKLLTGCPPPGRKLEVKDFVTHFRARFNGLKNIVQQHSELKNLVSIDKLSNKKQNVSIIGMVYDKKITKNKNIILEVEDLSGKINVLINQNKKELYEKAEEITLDSVIGIMANGDRNILFANEVIFPDAFLFERKHSPVEEYALFTGDLHMGSKRFLTKGFENFIHFLSEENAHSPEAQKVKYLFLVGDVITGIGNYPNQERDIHLFETEEHFELLHSYLKRIRKDIKIIISPGNHDNVRLMEPQPQIDEKYAWPLYDMENVIMTPNPSLVNVASGNGFSGFNVLTYHGFSYPFYANNISHLIKEKAMNCPEKIMTYLLKNRHLAPTHASTQYFPAPTDELLIKEVPDIFVSGHTHKSGVTYYNNIMIVSVSCWEGMTPYQEKFGNTPDHCKVPMINLKTRAVKILDFEDVEETKEKGV